VSQRILPRLAKRMHKKPSRQFMHTFSAILPLQIGSEITHRNNTRLSGVDGPFRPSNTIVACPEPRYSKGRR
jgi:hypothetical protein